MGFYIKMDVFKQVKGWGYPSYAVEEVERIDPP